MQHTIEFKSNHQQENNTENDSLYTVNLEALNNNCRTILEQLLTGRKLTGLDCAKLGILEYRRRFKDLSDVYKVPVQSEVVEGKRFKRWWLKQDFINKYLSA